MKVICIDDKPRPGDYTGSVNVKEGNTYTVLREAIGFGQDFRACRCYVLFEIPKSVNPNNLFEVNRFIRLSDIDETELINEKIEQCT